MESSLSQSACPLCDGPITASAKKCRHCQEWINRECESCGTPLKGDWAARGRCAECQDRTSSRAVEHVISDKSRGLAVVLALVLGGLGIHKFYLGRIGWGVVYFLLCWTFIPAFVAVIEAIILALMTPEEFTQKYGTPAR